MDLQHAGKTRPDRDFGAGNGQIIVRPDPHGVAIGGKPGKREPSIRLCAPFCDQAFELIEELDRRAHLRRARRIQNRPENVAGHGKREVVRERAKRSCQESH